MVKLEDYTTTELKKEVKKEVEKLDDVKVVVKPVKEEPVEKKEEPKKEEPKKEPEKKKEIKKLDIEQNILDFEEENKSWKQFLKDFKQGKTKFGAKIKLEDYEKNKIKLKKLLEKTEMIGRKLVNQDIRNESDFYKGLVKNFISERNKITRLYNKAKSRFNNLTYLLDYGGVEPKKEEPKKEDLITLVDKFNKKYNAVEIKKQNLNKSNLKDFTDPYFKQLEKIEKELDNVDDPIEFFKTNKKISSDFVDIKKNFVRRVKAQMKAVRKKK